MMSFCLSERTCMTSIEISFPFTSNVKFLPAFTLFLKSETTKVSPCSIFFHNPFHGQRLMVIHQSSLNFANGSVQNLLQVQFLNQDSVVLMRHVHDLTLDHNYSHQQWHAPHDQLSFFCS